MDEQPIPKNAHQSQMPLATAPVILLGPAEIDAFANDRAVLLPNGTLVKLDRPGMLHRRIAMTAEDLALLLQTGIIVENDQKVTIEMSEPDQQVFEYAIYQRLKASPPEPAKH